MFLEGAMALIIWFTISVTLPRAQLHNKQTRSLNELTHQGERRRTNLLFCSHIEGLKIWKRPKTLSPSEGGASRWHKAQNGRSLQSILSGDQNQDGAASSPMSLKWVWIFKKMPDSLMDMSTRASSPRGGCGKWWVLVHIQGFGAQMLLSQVFFLIICMQECAPGRTFSMILEGKRVGKWSPWQKTCGVLDLSVVSARKKWASIQICPWFVHDPPGLQPGNTTLKAASSGETIQIISFSFSQTWIKLVRISLRKKSKVHPENDKIMSSSILSKVSKREI